MLLTQRRDIQSFRTDNPAAFSEQLILPFDEVMRVFYDFGGEGIATASGEKRRTLNVRNYGRERKDLLWRHENQ